MALSPHFARVALVVAVTSACGPAGETDSDDPEGEAARAADAGPPGAAELAGRIVERLESLDDPFLDTLYGADPRPLWVDTAGPRPVVSAAVEALRAAPEEGLPARRYQLDAIGRLVARADPGGAPAGASPAGGRQPGPGGRDAAGPGRAELLAELDVALSRAVSRLARDLAMGALASVAFEHEWLLDSLDRPVPALPLADGPALLEHVEAVRPRAEQYARLVPVLADLRARAAGGGWPRVDADGAVLSRGATDPAVARLRARLEASENPEERRLAGEGRGRPELFDAALARSLTAFQERHALVADGVLGPRTADLLDAPVETWIDEVELALERWRWLPAELGATAVVVNTPGRLVHVLEDGRERLALKAIVGRRDWRTALFQSRMEEIVVNPFWNVPEGVMRAETLPRLLRDPAYLVDADLEIVDTTFEQVLPLDSAVRAWRPPPGLPPLGPDGPLPAPGAAPSRPPVPGVPPAHAGLARLLGVDSVAVDTLVLESMAGVDSLVVDSLAAGSFDYRFRQRPGPDNALGRVKFLFPNRFDVYLHDTPREELFDERIRTFSHGCVRVERPLELAHLLVARASGRSPGAVDSLLATGRTQSIRLEEPVAVYIVYQTVWVDENGVPTFTPDVYLRNGEALRAWGELVERAGAEANAGERGRPVRPAVAVEPRAQVQDVGGLGGV